VGCLEQPMSLHAESNQVEADPGLAINAFMAALHCLLLLEAMWAASCVGELVPVWQTGHTQSSGAV
jgi:hypothetical protein